MKIVLLAGGSSVHTIRWANGLSEAGLDVHLITQHQLTDGLRSEVTIHMLRYQGLLGYFLNARNARNILKRLKPDLVNAHYASGYGTTARLTNYRPWLLSLWGSDIYLFPRKSFIHRWLIRGNLRSADAIASTSHCMADEARKIAPDVADIAITPFGVDTANFETERVGVTGFSSEVTIGTVKSLKSIYGIDILLRAFANLLDRRYMHKKKLRLRIVGEGPQRSELEKLSDSLGISDCVEFVGFVPHSRISDEFARIDIFAALSRSESFGVAAIEAGAAGLPVVVSDVGGLPEVVIDGKTGIVVPSESVDAATAALAKLVSDETLCSEFGCNAKAHIVKNYSWSSSVKTMIGVYESVVARRKSKIFN